MQYRDYYQVLGLQRDASPPDVKRAYRKLASKYHPDVSKEKNAEEKFKQVQEAYEVLKDPEKRAAYDQLGRNYRAGQQFRPPPDWARQFTGGGGQFTGAGGGQGFEELHGFSDFFSTLFGQSSRGPRPDADGGELAITLEEAYSGVRRRVSLGREREARVVDVQIPAGVTDGQAIRIGGAERSPVVFRVKILPHARFALEAKDVRLDLPLAPWEAALGARVAVPTLGGTVELRVPAGAESGQKLRLRGRGLPGEPPGDQLVIVKIVTPPAHSAAAREAYERMRRDLEFDPRANWP